MREAYCKWISCDLGESNYPTENHQYGNTVTLIIGFSVANDNRKQFLDIKCTCLDKLLLVNNAFREIYV